MNSTRWTLARTLCLLAAAVACGSDSLILPGGFTTEITGGDGRLLLGARDLGPVTPGDRVRISSAGVTVNGANVASPGG